MKRFPLFATLLLAGVSFAGCEQKAALTQYNPQYDSVLPTYYNAIPDTSILEDQRTAYNRMRDANTHATPAAAPASATPATPPPPG